MEAELVLVFSGLGSSISLMMVVDAFQDISLVTNYKGLEGVEHKALLKIARTRAIDETVRLIIQFLILVVSIVYVTDRFAFVRQYAIFLLIAIPIILAGWSIFSYQRRRKWLNDWREG